VGVPIYIARELGIKTWDTVSYSQRPNVPEFMRLLRDSGSTLVPFKEVAHGDMLRMMSSRQPVHIGIYEMTPSGQAYVIHAFQPFKKVVRSPLTPQEWQKIQSVWRFPDVGS